MDDVIVCGGGIAGLACGVRLVAAGLDVRVLEEHDEPGGNVRTLSDRGFRMERGPHTFMASADDVFALADETGAAPDLMPALETSGVRFIVRDGRLHEAFTGPLSFIRSDLLSLRGKLDLITEPLRTTRGDESDSAARFFERRFGPEAARVLAGAFISGIYAGDPETLSAPAAFPLFWGFEKQHGGMIRGGVSLMRERRRRRRALGAAAPPRRKGLFSLRGGMGTMSRAAADVLGDRLELGAAVDAVARDGDGWRVEVGGRTLSCRRLVMAAPPHRAAPLFEPVNQRLGEVLASVTLAPVAMVHMCYEKRAAQIPDAFGFLVPRGEGFRTLGVLFPSRMFADRAPDGGDLLTGFVGGMLDRDALELDDGDLLDTVLGDLERLVGLDRRPDHVRVLRYAAAIPQLTHGHLDRMQELRDTLEGLPGMHLAGNYLRGVGLKDAVASGMAAADAVVLEAGRR
ncbi:MAG: protoporphyrinogen oxidase [Deltaproteobacteria bacterium]|nr:protoporphyrinogen oxidase [Deltaproteobacteria bacterium]